MALILLTTAGTVSETFRLQESDITEVSTTTAGSLVKYVDQAAGLERQIEVTDAPAVVASKGSSLFLFNKDDGTSIYLNVDRVASISGTTNAALFYDSDGSTTKKFTSSDTFAVVSANVSGQGDLITVSVTIPTASVLTGNTTPVDIAPAPGAGLSFDVISAVQVAEFNSVAYTTNLTTNIGVAGAGTAQMTFTNGLNFTADSTRKGTPVATATATAAQAPANAALQWSVATGDPAAGDSDVTYEIVYRLISV